jgi:hypothetical protein
MPIFILGGLLLFWVSNRLLLSVARGELAGIRRTRLIHLLSKGGPK